VPETETKLTKEQVDELIERTLHIARGSMRRWIGDRTTRQYDAADGVAEGVARGIRHATLEMGLRDKTEEDI